MLGRRLQGMLCDFVVVARLIRQVGGLDRAQRFGGPRSADLDNGADDVALHPTWAVKLPQQERNRLGVAEPAERFGRRRRAVARPPRLPSLSGKRL